jgi:FAD/FMN-containing dehydrogenase
MSHHDGRDVMANMQSSGAVGIAASGSGLTTDDVAGLRARLRGPVLVPDDDGYDEVRAVWNGMIDRRPAVIARCVDVPDVVTALEVVRRTGVIVAVRGGDHSTAGNAVCDGGLMIDLSLMKRIEVDPVGRTARVQPGVRWSEFDAAAQEHGLATTGGTNSDTGVAGLTLGGGLGWLAGKYGLACDNLLEAEVVIANGDVVRTNGQEHPDLFWALRGGSGNFGVVTSFTFRLHPVGPMVLAGLVLHPFERGTETMRFYRDFIATEPDEVNTIAGFLSTPDGTKVAAIAACHCGPLEEAEEALAALRAFGPPMADQLAAMPYTKFQQALDGSFPRGRRYYWKSTMIRDLTDATIDRLVEQFDTVPSPTSALLLQQLGNAANRVAADTTAFAHRDARWDGLVLASWDDPRHDAAHIDWARQTWGSLRPFSTGGVYVNGVADGDSEEIGGAYGNNLTRLSTLKAIYDPTNLFRQNANIAPPPSTPPDERHAESGFPV